MATQAAAPYAVIPSNFDAVRSLCREFISLMENNRLNCNDAGVAIEILRDLDERGNLRYSTRRRLKHWCHTNGTLYQRDVPIARRSSELLSGRVRPREE